MRKGFEMVKSYKDLLIQARDILGYTTDPDSAHYEDQLTTIADLQEAIDAPDPEPVGYFYCEDGHWQQAHDPIGFAGHTPLYLQPHQ